MSELDTKKQRIVDELKKGPKSSTELLESVSEGKNSMSKDTLYKNLKELELMGIIQHENDTSSVPMRKYYKLVDEKQKLSIKESIQNDSRLRETIKPELDINKMDWLREKIDRIISLDAEIQRTYASKPSLLNRKDSKLENLFEKFGNESLQAIQDLQGKYPEFDIRYQGDNFFDNVYHNYNWFREKSLDWHKGRGVMGKIRKDLNCESVGDPEPAVKAAHEFSTHISRFFVEWNKRSKKTS